MEKKMRKTNVERKKVALKKKKYQDIGNSEKAEIKKKDSDKSV